MKGRGRRLDPAPITGGIGIQTLVDDFFLSYAACVPLVEAGFVDWIVSTGANLYHDIHRSLGFELYGISPNVDAWRCAGKGSSGSTTSSSTPRCCTGRMTSSPRS